MHQPWRVYEMLLDSVSDEAVIDAVTLGQTWSACRIGERLGLAMSPPQGIRTLNWPGTLQGRPARDITSWIREWDPYQATVGMAAINASMAEDEKLITHLQPIRSTGPANLAVFAHFAPQLQGKKVVVVGRYPGMDAVLEGLDVTVLERQPDPSDLPDAAAEYILPEADWVFLTATSLINKTFPRLAELAQESTLVLMGPTTPWLSELSEFGVDYLAGVRVTDPEAVSTTLAEGGGTRLFESGLEYCVADLGAYEMDWVKTAIADTVARRESLKQEMEQWFSQQKKGRFPKQAELLSIDDTLSGLDSRYKRLWDARQ